MNIQELATRAYGEGAEVRNRDGQWWVNHPGGEVVVARSMSALQATLREKLSMNEGLIGTRKVAEILEISANNVSQKLRVGLPLEKRDEFGRLWFNESAVRAWALEHPKQRRGRRTGSVKREPRTPKRVEREPSQHVMRAPGTLNGILGVQVGVEAQKRLLDAYANVREFDVSYGVFVAKVLERGLESFKK